MGETRRKRERMKERERGERNKGKIGQGER